MTVGEEYERRNEEYMRQLIEDDEMMTRLEIMDEWELTGEEYDEMFCDGE